MGVHICVNQQTVNRNTCGDDQVAHATMEARIAPVRSREEGRLDRGEKYRHACVSPPCNRLPPRRITLRLPPLFRGSQGEDEKGDAGKAETKSTLTLGDGQELQRWCEGCVRVRAGVHARVVE